jgi:hypothetical protein
MSTLQSKPYQVILLLMVVLSISTSLAYGQCLDYSLSNPIVGWYEHWGGHYKEIVPYKNVLYAVGAHELSILDPSDPARIENIGVLYLRGDPGKMHIDGDRAYVSINDRDWDWPIAIWDISEPKLPVRIGHVYGVFDFIGVRNNIVYARSSVSGELVAYDTSDPENTIDLGSHDVGLTSDRFVIHDNFAFIDSSSTIKVLDLIDPGSPTVVFTLAPVYSFGAIAVSGDFLIGSSGGSVGTRVFDISNLPEIIPLGKKSETGGNIIDSAGDHLLIYASNGMNVFDATQLPELNYLHLIPHSRGVHFAAAVGTKSYEGDGDNLLRVVDYTVNPSQPELAWEWPQHEPISDLLALDGLLYVLTNQSFRVVDPKADGGPVVVGSTSFYSGRRFAISDGLVAAIPDNGRMSLIDVSDPKNIVEIRSFNAYRSRCRDVVMHGDYMFVAGPVSYWGGWISSISISDPSAPEVRGTIQLDTEVLELEMVQNVLIACTEEGIVSYRIKIDATSDRIVNEKAGTLEQIGFLEMPAFSEANDMRSVGDIVFLLADREVVAIDCSDPTQLNILDAYTLPSKEGSSQLVYRSGLLYVTTEHVGVAVIDANDPSDLREVGYINTGADVFGVAAGSRDLFTYTVEREAPYIELRSYALQCVGPDENFEITSLPLEDENEFNCRATGKLLRIAILSSTDHDALRVDHSSVVFGEGEAQEFHVHRGSAARHEKDVDGDGDVDLVLHFKFSDTMIGCEDDHVTMRGVTYDGVNFFGELSVNSNPNRLQDGTVSNAVAVYPNPFNPSTRILFTLDQRQRVQVGIYDISGRQVISLTDRSYNVGDHDVEWHGQDSTGRNVPSGQYFARIKTGDRIQVEKVLLLK